MNRFLIGAVMIGAMAGQLAAEPGSSALVVVVVPGLSWGWVDLGCDGQSGRRLPSFGYACDPLYGGSNRMSYPAQGVTVAMPQVVADAAPAPTASPEPPVRPVIREYHWPSSNGDTDGGKDRTPIDPVVHQTRR